MGNVLEKVSDIILLIICANFSLTMSSNLFIIIIYFMQMVMLRIRLVCTSVPVLKKIVLSNLSQVCNFLPNLSRVEVGRRGHKLGRRPNMGHFHPSCVRLVHFLRKYKEFDVKRSECQRILFHFLLLVFS